MVNLKMGLNVISVTITQRFLLSPCVRTGLFYLSKQYTSSDGNKSNNDYTNSSSSSYYRDFNRKKYEQKRMQFENENQPQELLAGFKQMNHYQRLNIANDAKSDEIKTAYYTLSKVYHPDIAGDNDEAAENFRLATESYDVLKDQNLREEYDRELRAHRSLMDITEPSSWMQSEYPKRQSDTNFRGDFNPYYVIYKSREDSALELEKLKNPRKFQAGRFEAQTGYTSKLNRHTSLGNRLREFQSSTRKNKDDFYKSHLYFGMRREYDDSSDSHAKEQEPRVPYDYRSEISSILGLGILIVIGVIFFICYLFKLNIADKLDNKFKRLVEEKELEKREKST